MLKMLKNHSTSYRQEPTLTKYSIPQKETLVKPFHTFSKENFLPFHPTQTHRRQISLRRTSPPARCKKKITPRTRRGVKGDYSSDDGAFSAVFCFLRRRKKRINSITPTTVSVRPNTDAITIPIINKINGINGAQNPTANQSAAIQSPPDTDCDLSARSLSSFSTNSDKKRRYVLRQETAV